MSSTAGKRVRVNTSMMFGAKGVGAVLALGGLVFAARGLTAEEFGLLVFMHAYVMFFTQVTTFESGLVVVKHAGGGRIGADAGKEDPDLFGRVVRFCVTLDLISAAAAFVLAMISLHVLAEFFDIFQQAKPYLTIYCLLILLNQKSASIGLLRLFNRFNVIAANTLIIPAGRMVGCGVAWAAGAPFEAFLATWFLASAASYLNLPMLCVRELRRRGMWTAAVNGRLTVTAPAAGLWRFVTLTNIDSAIATASAQLPVLLAGGIGGAHYAAIFRVAQEVAIVLAKGARLMDKIIFPEFTDLIARGAGGDIPKLAAKTGGALLAIGSAVALLFWVAGAEFLSFALGEVYARSTLLASLLIIGASLQAAATPLFPALYAAGLPGRAILARSAGLACMVPGFIALYLAFGDNGPGAALVLEGAVALLLVILISLKIDWPKLTIHKNDDRPPASGTKTD